MTQPARFHEWLKSASRVQRDADELGLGQPLPKPVPYNGDGPSILERFDETVTSESIRSASRKLFADGHYARAVEEAFKCLNNSVRDKSGLNDKDGASLMRNAFSAKSPVLTLNTFQSQSEKDEQLGYMEMFAGAMTGIRNPRAHEHELTDSPEIALEMLVLANHLMRMLDKSTLSSTS